MSSYYFLFRQLIIGGPPMEFSANYITICDKTLGSSIIHLTLHIVSLTVMNEDKLTNSKKKGRVLLQEFHDE